MKIKEVVRSEPLESGGRLLYSAAYEALDRAKTLAERALELDLKIAAVTRESDAAHAALLAAQDELAAALKAHYAPNPIPASIAFPDGLVVVDTAACDDADVPRLRVIVGHASYTELYEVERGPAQ